MGTNLNDFNGRPQTTNLGVRSSNLFRYSATFLTLGAAALVAAIVFALGMPETAEPEKTALQS